MIQLLLIVALIGSTSAHHCKDGLNKCQHHHHHHHQQPLAAAVIPQYILPASVAIPHANAFNYVKPAQTFTTTGLIQVQYPTQFAPLAPAVLATRPQFTVASARMGKVVDQTQPTYFCKRPGFTLEGQVCVQTLLEEPRLVCPGGFDTVDGGCQRRASVLQTCPAGYSRRNGNCAKLITASATSRCPDGSTPTPDSGCERQIAHPLTPSCPEGHYDARIGSCIVMASVEPRAFCPEGFTFVDGVCLQEEVYDCSNQIAPQLGAIASSLQLTTHATKHKHSPHARRLTSFSKDCSIPCKVTTCTVQPCPPAPPCIAQRAAVPCEVAPQAQVLVQPTKTTISVQKTCTRVTSTALVLVCDEGFLRGNKCQVKQTVPPVPVCNAQGDATYCYAVQRVPVLLECPTDFTKECLPGRQCQCIALEAAAFLQSCPTGFDHAADGCVRVAAVRPICPPGYALQGDTCAKVIREPADCVFSVTYECDPKGLTECAPPPTGAIGTFSSPSGTFSNTVPIF